MAMELSGPAWDDTSVTTPSVRVMKVSAQASGAGKYIQVLHTGERYGVGALRKFAHQQEINTIRDIQTNLVCVFLSRTPA